MNRAVLLCALSMGWPALAHADIYKCVDSYAIVYQSAPCAAGQAQTLMSVRKRAAAVAEPAQSVQPPSRVPYGRDVAFRRTTIALGISDDEVLNMPGWGVPRRIERSRDGRVYREAWFYDLPDGRTRSLYFANAKLAGMDVDYSAPPERIAGFAAR